MILLGLLLLLVYWIYFFENREAPALDNVKVLGGFAIVQLIYTLWSWHYCERSWINAYTVFILALYAFNLGQPMLEVFNVDIVKRSLVRGAYGVEINTFYRATFVSLLFSLFFHIGALLSSRLQNTLKTVAVKRGISHYCQIRAIKRVATYLGVVTFPFYIYNLIVRMIAVALHGYSVLYNEDVGVVRLFTLIGDFYVPCLICLFFVSEYEKKRIWLIRSIIIATVLLPPFFLGGRSNIMVILAIMYIIYALFNTINIRKLLIVGISLYALLFVFGIIIRTRNEGQKNYALYTQTIKSEEDDLAVSTLVEMGWSLYPLCCVLDITPVQEDYRYGSSYLYALSSLVPNVGFWDVHPAKLNANLGDWLKDYMGLNYGPGFSLVAEAYYNFGYLGCMILFFFGIYFTRAFRYVNRDNVLANPILLVIAVVFLWLSIKTVRNSTLAIVRAVFYYSLPMYWLMMWQYRKIRSKIKQ